MVDQWHTLLNPDGKAINNAHIHGITNADVAQAPLFRDIYTEFAARLDGMVLMAHNAPFDSKMLASEVDRITPPGTPDDAVFFGFVDTIALAKQLVDAPSDKLSSLLELVGLANPNAHVAIADATATGMLFNKLLDGNAAQLGRQILDQAQFFNAAHAQCWQHPQRPPLPRR